MIALVAGLLAIVGAIRVSLATWRLIGAIARRIALVVGRTLWRWGNR